MNINKRVIEKLEQFVAKGPKESDAVVLDSRQQKGYIVGVITETEGFSLSFNLTDYDRFSVTLRHLQVNHNNPPADGDIEDYLQQRTEQIIHRLTYLEELLELLELEPDAGVAQLRSNLPHRENEETIYWEALLQAKPRPTVSLTRYHWTPDSREREVLAYPATFATLGRIAQDLAESLIVA
jgi:hypothetical protein